MIWFAFGSLCTFSFLVGSFIGGARARRQARAGRQLPLPLSRQIWNIEGIGRVRIDKCENDEVYFNRPADSPDADPLDDAQWRENPISAPPAEFDKGATLERR